MQVVKISFECPLNWWQGKLSRTQRFQRASVIACHLGVLLPSDGKSFQRGRLRHGHTNTDRLCTHFSYLNPSSEVNSFEYKQRALLETIGILVHCVLSFPKRNTASKTSLGVTPVHCSLSSAVKIESLEATNWSRCKRYGAFPNVSIAPVLCPRQQCRQP